jgi:hypothetical protein
MRHGRWPGTWKTVCDVCGFWFPSEDLKDRWDGLKVCAKDWEIKHPQLTIRVPPEHVAPPWTRPDPPDSFVPGSSCTLWGRSAYADLATADCAQADYSLLSYAFLLNLKNVSS